MLAQSVVSWWRYTESVTPGCSANAAKGVARTPPLLAAGSENIVCKLLLRLRCHTCSVGGGIEHALLEPPTADVSGNTMGVVAGRVANGSFRRHDETTVSRNSTTGDVYYYVYQY